jgi:hypothetical protein
MITDNHIKLLIKWNERRIRAIIVFFIIFSLTVQLYWCNKDNLQRCFKCIRSTNGRGVACHYNVPGILQIKLTIGKSIYVLED